MDFARQSSDLRQIIVFAAIIVWHIRRSSRCWTSSRRLSESSSSVLLVQMDRKRFIDTYLFCRKSTVILIPFLHLPQHFALCRRTPFIPVWQSALQTNIYRTLDPFYETTFSSFLLGCLLPTSSFAIWLDSIGYWHWTEWVSVRRFNGTYI